MNFIRTSSARSILILMLSTISIIVTWGIVRFWLLGILRLGPETTVVVNLLFTGFMGVAWGVILPRVASREAGEYIGLTEGNAVKLLVQVIVVALFLVAILEIAGVTSTVYTVLVGAGFLGLIVGLAAQAVLGNLFSGFVLLTSRPFRIGDRIALVSGNYGKFAPSLNHGWLEPSYTGEVREITLMYTKVLTDSNVLIAIPNGIVTASMIQNLSFDGYAHVGTQVEVPVSIDPDILHSKLEEAADTSGFEGEEETFELLELSSTVYLIAISYKVEKRRGRELKSKMLKMLRSTMSSLNQPRE